MEISSGQGFKSVSWSEKEKAIYIYREISEAARLESRSDKERKKESSYKRKVSV